MGRWGMGIAQSDEYCEVYERFMEEYDEGKPLPAIKKDILDEYLEEFDENDGILHDVFFAIGKAEWMCGGISEDVFEKVAQIVRSGENISFYRELEVSENDLKLRRRNLDKFLKSLSEPRGKTKKRKIPTEKYVEVPKVPMPKLPPFRCGDIFAYDVGGKYRLLCLISRGEFNSTHAAYCYVWTELYEKGPSVEELMNDCIIPLGYFTVETFPDMEKLRFVGNCPDMVRLDIIYPGFFYEPWKAATWTIAREEHLSEDFQAEFGRKLEDCLSRFVEWNSRK